MGVGEGQELEEETMIDYAVEILLMLTASFFVGLVAGIDHAERKAWNEYEQWRREVTRERLHRIRW